jgi:tetratricopeptide (TPR) repeat protein
MKKLWASAIMGMVFCIWAAVVLHAKESKGTPEAKAEVEKARQAYRNRDLQAELAAYRKAIELDPYYLEAHERYVAHSRAFPLLSAWFASGNPDPPLPGDPQLSEKMKAAAEGVIKQYEGWVRKDPQNAVYQWALGWAYHDVDHAKAEQHYRKAVKLDPQLARGWQSLSQIAEMRGEGKKSREYLRKAAEAVPDDPEYLSRYVDSFKAVDPKQFRKLTLELVDRFPKSDTAPFALWWLAASLDDPAERISILERLRKDYPAQGSRWLRMLLDEYAKTDPAKAVAFAQEMTKVDAETWQPILDKQQYLFDAARMISEKKYTEAGALLEKVKSEREISVNNDRLELLKTELLDGQKQTAKAYENLSKYVAATPTDASLAALTKYGAKLGKSSAELNADVAKIRLANSAAVLPNSPALSAQPTPVATNESKSALKPISDFALEGYGENAGKKFSLADYKGKVVLLNFWYPG